MKIKEVFAKSSLVPSKLSQFTINPYLGCGHGCKYCYASMIMQRWHHRGEVWGEFVDVRVNTPQNVAREIKNKGNIEIYLSSMTDCYQPLEKKYEITRKTLIELTNMEGLFSNNCSITIQTKSNLVLRDLDILKAFKNLTIGITITTLDESYYKVLEPFASSPFERLEALSKLNKENIATYAFFGPILPKISDDYTKMRGIVRKISDTGTKTVIIDKLNYFSNLKNLHKVVSNLGFFDEFRRSQTEDYTKALRQKANALRKEFPKIDFKIVF
jgi:DNA repair photolyase